MEDALALTPVGHAARSRVLGCRALCGLDIDRDRDKAERAQIRHLLANPTSMSAGQVALNRRSPLCELCTRIPWGAPAQASAVQALYRGSELAQRLSIPRNSSDGLTASLFYRHVRCVHVVDGQGIVISRFNPGRDDRPLARTHARTHLHRQYRPHLVVRHCHTRYPSSCTTTRHP